LKLTTLLKLKYDRLLENHCSDSTDNCRTSAIISLKKYSKYYNILIVLSKSNNCQQQLKRLEWCCWLNCLLFCKFLKITVMRLIWILKV